MSDEKHAAEQPHRSREAIRAMINDVACCPRDQYCTLKEILCRSPRQTREILQIKCVEKFKYERSEHEHRAIDWQEAFELWVAEGHAATFARAFHDGVRFAELYRAVMHHHPPREHA